MNWLTSFTMVSQRMILIMILKMTPKMNPISEPPNEPQNVSIKAITRARAARAPGGEETASAHHHDSNNRANRTQSQSCLIERCSRLKCVTNRYLLAGSDKCGQSCVVIASAGKAACRASGALCCGAVASRSRKLCKRRSRLTRNLFRKSRLLRWLGKRHPLLHDFHGCCVS